MDGLIKKITSGPTPSVPSHYSEDWKAVIRMMLAKDEDQRPSADDILRLPWLQVGGRVGEGCLPEIHCCESKCFDCQSCSLL